jgi:hypothetical protein
MKIGPVINIAFWGIALAWILKLEKDSCTCSADWRRDYMKYYFMLAIVLQVLMVAKKNIKVLAIPAALATLLYLWASISYINDQRKKNCECSKSRERLALFIFSVFQAIFITWAVLKHKS